MKTLMILALMSAFNLSDPATLTINKGSSMKCSKKGQLNLEVSLLNNSSNDLMFHESLLQPAFIPFPIEFIMEQKSYFNTFFLVYDESGNQIHNSSFPVPTKKIKCKTKKSVNLPIEIKSKSNFKKQILVCLKDLNLTKGKKYSIILAVSQEKDGGIANSFNGFIKSNIIEFVY